MKKSLSLALSLTLVLSLTPFAFAQEQTVPLQNKDIVMMVKANIPAEIIVEKIKTSACNFDPFPSVLAELKYGGVPDEVLTAKTERAILHSVREVNRKSAAAPPSASPARSKSILRP